MTDKLPTTDGVKSSDVSVNVGIDNNVIQKGEKNTFVQHADTVNINAQPPITPSTPSKTTFGGKKISNDDAKLLAKFKKEYDKILQYCIITDPTGQAFYLEYTESIAEKFKYWQFQCLHFDSAEIRKIVTHTLTNLNEYLYYLSDKYMRLVPDKKYLLFRNQSPEEGRILDEELRPNSLRLRKELRDRYYELWDVEKPTQTD